ncbi:MAG: hypothetical protein LBJ60_08710 [Tannerellaceae bacterium]|jgi:hypothetical protein|nr:hypothetical protein [Tannerellaceae bacterium]
MKKEKLTGILLGLACLIMHDSCAKLVPAGFWNEYQKQFIQEKESDQGPWGGYRKIVWESNKIKLFDTENIMDYSRSNGWLIADSLLFSNDSILILTNYGKTDYSFRILEDHIIPLLDMGSVYQIYVFTTGWIAVEPGNARETEKNGFVLLESGGKRMIVYHTWGE